MTKLQLHALKIEWDARAYLVLFGVAMMLEKPIAAVVMGATYFFLSWRASLWHDKARAQFEHTQ